MAPRFIFAAALAAAAFACPAAALAATAPANPPTLASAPYARPATFNWVPAVSDPNAPLDPDTAQQVFRSDGPCPAGAVTTGQSVGPVHDMTVTSHTTSTNLANGVYCFHIRTASLLGGIADGPGLTVSIDTENPTGTVAVTPLAPGRIVTGTVGVTGTSADAVAGVSSSTFHVGAVNACATGVVIGATWDTTALPNGIYQVCNVIVDNAGHQTVIPTRVVIANPVQPAGAAAPAAGSAPAPAVSPPLPAPAPNPAAPRAPRAVTFTLPRAKGATGTVGVTLRWVKPSAADLARVVVVLNLKRLPRTPTDGVQVYKGLGTSTVLRLRAGSTGYVALYAYDHGDNVSPAARKVVSLAPLIPLRPTSGSSLAAPPRLTWKSQAATAYYNVQLFHNGSRVLTGWPTHPSFRIPAGKLEPGTYVWFVWPAVKHGRKTPAFGKLIGRATFVYHAH